jgi:hypothetical protein
MAKTTGNFICTTCKSVGNPKTTVKGSFVIELILWLCFLLPGLIYTTWRLTSKSHTVCPKCLNPTMIPLNTPYGKQIYNESNKEN